MLNIWLALVACDMDSPKATGAGVSSTDDTTGTVDDTTSEETTPEVSWYADIQPLLRDNCLSCHADTGISFSLEDPVVAAAMGVAMVDAVASGRMPPWPASEDHCQPLRDSRTLSDDQIALLDRWVALGAPEGRPEDAPDDTVEDGRIFEEDITLQLDEPFTPALDREDDYRCFVLDAGLDSLRYVTGMEVHPGNSSIVHHVILYTDPGGETARAMDAAEDGLGYTCFGGPGFNNTGVIGGWAPGQGTVWLPEGMGLALAPDADIVAQVHYHPVNDPGGSDQTTIVLDMEDQVDTVGYLLPLANQGLHIPAGATEHVEVLERSLSFGISGRVWGGTPHMHLLGQSIRVGFTAPGAKEETCLIDVPQWDFDYQNFYLLEEPVTIEDGSTIRMECVYDNSADNPHQPNDPPADVGWGDGTADEMCLTFALVSF